MESNLSKVRNFGKLSEYEFFAVVGACLMDSQAITNHY